jgi:hypothetical protein
LATQKNSGRVRLSHRGTLQLPIRASSPEQFSRRPFRASVFAARNRMLADGASAMTSCGAPQYADHPRRARTTPACRCAALNKRPFDRRDVRYAGVEPVDNRTMPFLLAQKGFQPSHPRHSGRLWLNNPHAMRTMKGMK